MKYTFWFECTDNGGGHQAFEVKAENHQIYRMVLAFDLHDIWLR